MQIPKNVIEKAIEGGWKNYPSDFGLNDHYLVMHDIACITALDPTFWQALGKALGWKWSYRCPECKEVSDLPTWEFNAKRFYDLILQEKPTEEFWSDLLK